MREVLVFTLLGGLGWSQPLVIKRVTVIDATGKAAQPDMTVVMEGDRIAAVTPWKKAKLPKNAQVVDGMGKFLIPGLWDMHAHNATNARFTWSYALYLANGVVGVRDMNGPSDANAWREQQGNLR
jgi:imidazolonepropionase-like amidohydrolase